METARDSSGDMPVPRRVGRCVPGEAFWNTDTDDFAPCTAYLPRYSVARMQCEGATDSEYLYQGGCSVVVPTRACTEKLA